MPNSENILSPVTLVSFGRSGTTLVSKIFEKYPGFSSVGETANLIFGPWKAVESSAGIVPTLKEGNILLSVQERAARVVRQTFLTCFPDEQPYWFQKPINVPTALALLAEDNDRWQEAGEWYWDVMQHTFPNARFFTILRHPCDVILSAQSYWGYNQAGLWRAMAFMASIVMHPRSPIRYALHFEELIKNPDRDTHNLFSFLGLPFCDQVLKAFAHVYVPSEYGKQALEPPKRLKKWDHLDPDAFEPFYREHLDALFGHFDYELNWPSHLMVNKVTTLSQTPERALQSLAASIDLLHQKHSVESRELNNNLKILQNKLNDTLNCVQEKQNEIAQLEASNEQLRNELEGIYHGRIWQLAGKYWTIKERWSNTVAWIKNAWLNLVPLDSKLAWKMIRHPRELIPVHSSTNSTPPAPGQEYTGVQPSRQLNIAYLIWSLPYPLNSGGQIRSYQLLRHLAAQNEVHLHIPSWQAIDIPQELLDLCTSVTVHRLDYATWRREVLLWQIKGLPRSVVKLFTSRSLLEFVQTVATRSTDLVFVDEAIVAPYAWPLQIPCILARQKADHLFYQDMCKRMPFGKAKLGAWIEAALYKRYESQLWKRFKYGVVVSDQEHELFLRFNPLLNLNVIPNGVDVSHFHFEPLPDNPRPIIMFHGLMSYYPNKDAALWFAAQIWPLIKERSPQTRFIIVGRDPPSEIRQLADGDQIVVTGTVPEMLDYLVQSYVVVVPVRIGHGTRLKILEALSVGRPVVSTSTGVEGLSAQSGRDLLVADDPTAFADGVVRVLTDRSLAESLARQGRQLVEQEYSWQRIGNQLEQYCRIVVEKEA